MANSGEISDGDSDVNVYSQNEEDSMSTWRDLVHTSRQGSRLDLSTVEEILCDPDAFKPSIKDHLGLIVQTVVKMCIVAEPRRWRKLFSDAEDTASIDVEVDLRGQNPDHKRSKKKQLDKASSSVQKWEINLAKVTWQAIINDVKDNVKGKTPNYNKNHAGSCKTLFKHRYEHDPPTESKCIFGDTLCALMVKLYYARCGASTEEDKLAVLGKKILDGYAFALESNPIWKYRLVLSETFLPSYPFALSETMSAADYGVIVDETTGAEIPDSALNSNPSTVNNDQPKSSASRNVPRVPKGTIPDLIPYEDQIDDTERTIKQIETDIKLHEKTIDKLKHQKMGQEEKLTLLKKKKEVQEENELISKKCRELVPVDMEFGPTITSALEVVKIIIENCKSAGIKNVKEFTDKINFEDFFKRGTCQEIPDIPKGVKSRESSSSSFPTDSNNRKKNKTGHNKPTTKQIDEREPDNQEVNIGKKNEEDKTVEERDSITTANVHGKDNDTDAGSSVFPEEFEANAVLASTPPAAANNKPIPDLSNFQPSVVDEAKNENQDGIGRKEGILAPCLPITSSCTSNVNKNPTFDLVSTALSASAISADDKNEETFSDLEGMEVPSAAMEELVSTSKSETANVIIPANDTVLESEKALGKKSKEDKERWRVSKRRPSHDLGLSIHSLTLALEKSNEDANASKKPRKK